MSSGNNSYASGVIRIVLWTLLAVVLVAGMVAIINGNGFSNAFSGISFGGVNYDEHDYTIGAASVDADGVDEIDINWTSGSVVVSVYDGDEIKFTENDGLASDEQLRYKLSGGKLTIQFRKSSIFYFHESSKKLEMLIPASLLGQLNNFSVDVVSSDAGISDIVCKNMEIDTVSGTVRINRSSAEKLNVNSVSGSMTVAASAFDDVDIDSVSGKCEFDGKAVKFDFNSTSGDLTFKSNENSDEIDTDTISGEVFLYLPENGGFTAELDSVSGDFDSDCATSHKDGKYIYGSGETVIECESVSGDLFIGFAK